MTAPKSPTTRRGTSNSPTSIRPLAILSQPLLSNSNNSPYKPKLPSRTMPRRVAYKFLFCGLMIFGAVELYLENDAIMTTLSSVTKSDVELWQNAWGIAGLLQQQEQEQSPNSNQELRHRLRQSRARARRQQLEKQKENGGGEEEKAEQSTTTAFESALAQRFQKKLQQQQQSKKRLQATRGAASKRDIGTASVKKDDKKAQQGGERKSLPSDRIAKLKNLPQKQLDKAVKRHREEEARLLFAAKKRAEEDKEEAVVDSLVVQETKKKGEKGEKKAKVLETHKKKPGPKVGTPKKIPITTTKTTTTATTTAGTGTGSDGATNNLKDSKTTTSTTTTVSSNNNPNQDEPPADSTTGRPTKPNNTKALRGSGASATIPDKMKLSRDHRLAATRTSSTGLRATATQSEVEKKSAAIKDDPNKNKDFEAWLTGKRTTKRVREFARTKPADAADATSKQVVVTTTPGTDTDAHTDKEQNKKKKIQPPQSRTNKTREKEKGAMRTRKDEEKPRTRREERMALVKAAQENTKKLMEEQQALLASSLSKGGSTKQQQPPPKIKIEGKTKEKPLQKKQATKQVPAEGDNNNSDGDQSSSTRTSPKKDLEKGSLKGKVTSSEAQQAIKRVKGPTTKAAAIANDDESQQPDLEANKRNKNSSSNNKPSKTRKDTRKDAWVKRGQEKPPRRNKQEKVAPIQSAAAAKEANGITAAELKNKLLVGAKAGTGSGDQTATSSETAKKKTKSTILSTKEEVAKASAADQSSTSGTTPETREERLARVKAAAERALADKRRESKTKEKENAKASNNKKRSNAILHQGNQKSLATSFEKMKNKKKEKRTVVKAKGTKA